MSSTFDKAKEIAITSALAGGVGYLGSKYVLGHSGSVTLPYVGSVATPVAMGAAAGGGNAAGVLAKDFILPYVPGASSISGTLGRALTPALAGAGTVLVAKIGGLDSQSNFSEKGMLTTFGLGAASSVAGQYVHDSFFSQVVPR